MNKNNFTSGGRELRLKEENLHQRGEVWNLLKLYEGYEAKTEKKRKNIYRGSHGFQTMPLFWGYSIMMPNKITYLKRKMKTVRICILRRCLSRFVSTFTLHWSVKWKQEQLGFWHQQRGIMPPRCFVRGVDGGGDNSLHSL